MTHPLDGARLKVVRAQEHLDCLKVAIADYEQRNPYSIKIGNSPSHSDTSADVTEHPEMRISAVIGDCLQNLNSALDYVMWEIAGTFANRVLEAPPIGDDAPHFPIFDEVDNFNVYVARLNNPRKWNYKIPTPVISAFASVQPYNTGYERLWAFKILVNTDKHRLPLTTKGEIRSFQVETSRVRISSDFPPHLTSDTAYYAPQLKAQATVHVTWQDSFMPSEPVARTMQDFVELVADIIPRFDNFVL